MSFEDPDVHVPAFCRSLSQLIALQHLHIHNSFFTLDGLMLAASMQSLTALRSLALHGTRLRILPIPRSLGSLQSLDLALNCLQGLPTFLSLLTRLTELDCSCQGLEFQLSAPLDFLQSMSALQHFTIGGREHASWSSTSMFIIADAMSKLEAAGNTQLQFNWGSAQMSAEEVHAGLGGSLSW